MVGNLLHRGHPDILVDSLFQSFSFSPTAKAQCRYFAESVTKCMTFNCLERELTRYLSVVHRPQSLPALAPTPLPAASPEPVPPAVTSGKCWVLSAKNHIFSL